MVAHATEADLAAWERATPEARLRAFQALAPGLDDVVYWRFLATTWLHGGDWCGPYYHRLFLGYFNSPRPCRHRLMAPEERETRRAWPERLTVYRGYAGHEEQAGISWTLDPATADYFAHAFHQACPGAGSGPRIVEGACRRQETICYLNGRGEHEVIIDPSHVTVERDYPTVRVSSADY
jgi:hypothetical protein